MTEQELNDFGYTPILEEDADKIIESIISELLPICKGRTIRQIETAFERILCSIRFYQTIGVVLINRSTLDLI